MCKWWTVSLISCLAFWSTTAQPVTEKVENDRQIRQANECCPCPGADSRRSENMGGENPFNRQKSLEDCPCITRSADPEVSPSILVPSVIRPVSSTRSSEVKGELKPLLHPEVGLASSVLQTLREATENEYEEAVARDAARSATKAKEAEISISKDAPEVQKNVVNIVIKTRDSTNEDMSSEASNVQETNCSPGNILKTSSISQELLGVRKEGMDSAVDSSNVKTNIIGINQNIDDPKIKHGNFLNNLLFNNRENVQNDLLAVKETSFLNKNNLPGLKLKTIEPFKESNALKKLQEITGHIIKTPLIPAFKTGLKNNGDKFHNTDLNTSPSVIQKQIESNNNHDLFKLKLNTALLKNKDVDFLDESPKTLKNIFQFKDVELIPPKELTNPINISGKSALPQIPKLKDLFKNLKTKNEEINNDDNESTRMVSLKKLNNIQIVPKNKPKTEILDTVPSPSENRPLITSLNNIDNCNIEASENIPLMTMASPASITEDKTDVQIEETEDDVDNQMIEINFKDNESFREDCSSEDEDVLPDINRNNIAQSESPREIKDLVSPTTLLQDSQSFSKESCIKMPQDEKENIQLRASHKLLLEESYSKQPQLSVSSSRPNEFDEKGENKKTINIQDLQSLSDSILNASVKKETQKNFPKEMRILNDNNILNQDNRYKESDVDDVSSLENTDSDINTLSPTSDVGDQIDNKCPTDLFSKSSTLDSTKEMNVEASEPIFSRLSLPSIKSSTNDLIDSLRNGVLEPSSLIDPDPLNIFRSPSIINLPTISDLRARLSNMLDQRKKDFASEVGFDNTNTNSVISTGVLGTARTPLLPSLKSLDGIGTEHVKVNGITPTLGNFKLPRDNLKVFKARLATPKSLNIKPLRIESFEGNKPGNLESSGKVRAKKPSRNRTSQIPKQYKYNSRKNKNTLGSNLHSSVPVYSIHDNIRSHAEEIARNIQESLDTTFNENKINLLGESLVPDNLLRMAANSHDEVQNKLQSLHSDLSDRLSSLQSNILEQPRYPSFRMPTLNVRSSKPKLGIPKRNKIELEIVTPKRKSELNTIQKPFASRKVSQRNEQASNAKPASRINSKTSQPRTIELPTAANIIIPKIAYPNSNNKPSKLLSKMEQNKPYTNTVWPEFNNFKDTSLGEARHDPLENAVPVFSLSKQSPDSELLLRSAEKWNPPFRSNLQSNMEKRRKIPISRSHFGTDPFESPSEVRQTNILPPYSTFKLSNQQDEITDSSFIKGPKPPTLKHDAGPPIPALKTNTAGPKPPTLGHGVNTAPKETNNVFPNINTLKTLRSKLRRPAKDSLEVNPQEKVLLSPLRDSRLREVSNNSEMAQPTANNHVHIKTDDFMKENVNYKCKLLCTKE